MKIIMRRDSVIFHVENNRIDNAVKAVSFKLKSIFQFEKSIRREHPDCIELLAFQWNKWGHSFTVEVSMVFPDRLGFAANLAFESPPVSFSDVTVWHTNRRFRLKGMYDGWFYYTDVYRRKHFLQRPSYIPVGEKEASTFQPGRRDRLIQKADARIYQTVCEEVNRQMGSAYQWWAKMRSEA